MTNPLAQDLGGVVRPEDLTFSEYPETRQGGMHVGLPKGVRAIHTPTGIEVACKHYRSQHLNRDACIRAIEAALTERTHSAEIAGALRDAEGWRPIESAPKSFADGTSVDGVYLLGFIPDPDACDPKSCMDTIWWEPLLPNGRGGRGKWCAGKSDIEAFPTHWMPLPEPPNV